MKCFLVDPDFFPNLQKAVQMAPDKGENPPKKIFRQPQPFVHANNI